MANLILDIPLRLSHFSFLRAGWLRISGICIGT